MVERRSYNLCIVGFGNVGKALVKLLQRKSGELREQYSIEWKITGIASRSLGWIASAGGLNPNQLLDDDARSLMKPTAQDVRDWSAAAGCRRGADSNGYRRIPRLCKTTCHTKSGLFRR